MVCVYCGSKTKITNSRPQRRSNQKWRRRRCLGCKVVFTTHEAVDLGSTLLVGTKPFLSDMLFTEVLLALQDRQDAYLAARSVTNTVINKLLKLPSSPRFSPPQISRETAKVLKRLDRRSWLRYIAEHPSLQRQKP